MTMTQETGKINGITLEEHSDLRLSLEEAGDSGTAIIHLAGLIDTYNSDFFRSQASRVVEAGYKNLIIDSSATTFMSSTGIGAFTALLKTVRKKNGTMIIYGMPAKIFDVFQLLGFTSFFRFCDSKEDALALLSVDTLPVSVFPLRFACPVCSRQLRAIKAGRFRCSACRVILSVNSTGEIGLG